MSLMFNVFSVLVVLCLFFLFDTLLSSLPRRRPCMREDNFLPFSLEGSEKMPCIHSAVFRGAGWRSYPFSCRGPRASCHGCCVHEPGFGGGFGGVVPEP